MMKDKQKRFVRTFQPRFARLVEQGIKTQTIRKTPKRMPRVGDIIDCREWTGKPYRSKQRKLIEAVIKSVEVVTIEERAVYFPTYKLAKLEMHNWAKDDGFKGWGDMRNWFLKNHSLPFTGIEIKW